MSKTFLCVGDRGLMINIQMYHDVSPRLGVCNLTEKSCSYLASALTSHSSSLTLLDLSNNELLGDSGVELLCSALSHQNCKREELHYATFHGVSVFLCIALETQTLPSLGADIFLSMPMTLKCESHQHP